MTAVFESYDHRSAGSGGDPVVPTPPGTVDGNLLIAIGLCTAGQTISLSGKSVHAESLGSANPLWIWVASSEPADRTFVTSGALTNGVAAIARISGQHELSAVDVASGATAAGGTAGIVIPTRTPTGPNRLLMQMVLRLTSTLFTPPGTVTERWDVPAASGSLGSAGGDEIVGASPIGSRTWTSASASGGAVGYMIAIKPRDDSGAALLGLI